jgi:hypothetical protein
MNHNDEQIRIKILDRCKEIKNALDDVPPQPGIQGHRQEVDSLELRAKKDPNLQKVSDDQCELIGRLKIIRAADGEEILSARRWQKFMT